MTIAIIDKHPIVRSGVRLVLNDHFGINNILESDGITAFYEKFQDAMPDVIIISMSQEEGISNLQTLGFIKKFYSISTTIMYDEHVEPAMVRKYFQFGITGYLCKTDTLTELVTCIQKILKGRHYISSDLLYVLLQDVPMYKKKSSKKLKVYLTKRENEIAEYLINGQKTSEIARNLERKASTISTIKANIFKKMKVSNIVNLKSALSY